MSNGKIPVTMKAAGISREIPGLAASLSRTTGVPLSEKIPSWWEREVYVRVNLENSTVVPLPCKVGLMNTLVKINGLVCIPEVSGGIENRSGVEVIAW